MFDKGKLIVFTNDFFTVYQNSDSGEMDISLNEIGNLIQIYFKKFQKSANYYFKTLLVKKLCYLNYFLVY